MIFKDNHSNSWYGSTFAFLSYIDFVTRQAKDLIEKSKSTGKPIFTDSHKSDFSFEVGNDLSTANRPNGLFVLHSAFFRVHEIERALKTVWIYVATPALYYH